MPLLTLAGLLAVTFQTVKTGAPNPVFHHAQPFFKLLTLLVEFNTGTMGPQLGLPNFIQIVLHKMWDVSHLEKERRQLLLLILFNVGFT